MKDFLRDTLREVDGIRDALRERLYALELADDLRLRLDANHLSEQLEAGKAEASISADDFRERYSRHLVG